MSEPKPPITTAFDKFLDKWIKHSMNKYGLERKPTTHALISILINHLGKLRDGVFNE